MIVSADDFSAYQSLVKLCGVYDLKLSPSGGTGERMWPSGKALKRKDLGSILFGSPFS